MKSQAQQQRQQPTGLWEAVLSDKAGTPAASGPALWILPYLTALCNSPGLKVCR